MDFVGWRLLAGLGCLTPAALFMLRYPLPRTPGWLPLLGVVIAGVSAALLARRLGRWAVLWGPAASLLLGIPGLVLCTLDGADDEPRAPSPEPRPEPRPEPPRRREPAEWPCTVCGRAYDVCECAYESFGPGN